MPPRCRPSDWCRTTVAGSAVTNNKPRTADGVLILELATENTELRLQLAEVQDQCVELAVDSGALHAEIEALRAQLVDVERQWEAWCAEAECVARRASA